MSEDAKVCILNVWEERTSSNDTLNRTARPSREFRCSSLESSKTFVGEYNYE